MGPVAGIDKHADYFYFQTAFVMFALGGIQSTAFNQIPTGVTSVDQLLYISASMAFSLLFTVWLFARSVTLSLSARLSLRYLN